MQGMIFLVAFLIMIFINQGHKEELRECLNSQPAPVLFDCVTDRGCEMGLNERVE